MESVLIADSALHCATRMWALVTKGTSNTAASTSWEADRDMRFCTGWDCADCGDSSFFEPVTLAGSDLWLPGDALRGEVYPGVLNPAVCSSAAASRDIDFLVDDDEGEPAGSACSRFMIRAANCSGVLSLTFPSKAAAPATRRALEEDDVASDLLSHALDRDRLERALLVTGLVHGDEPSGRLHRWQRRGDTKF